mgnify:FL=1
MESNKMDKIRQLNLAKMEQHYADRMIVLVDDLQLAKAEALMQEMTYTGEEYQEVDLFLDDLTDWLDSPFPGSDLKFYDKDD